MKGFPGYTELRSIAMEDKFVIDLLKKYIKEIKTLDGLILDKKKPSRFIRTKIFNRFLQIIRPVFNLTRYK